MPEASRYMQLCLLWISPLLQISPIAIAVDSRGNLFVINRRFGTEPNYIELPVLRIRRIDAATGTITTIAGNGTRGFDGNNSPAGAASLFSPESIAVDSAGNVFIGDQGRIRAISVTSGLIFTVAGGGGYSGGGAFPTVPSNGPATESYIEPAAIAVDSVRRPRSHDTI